MKSCEAQFGLAARTAPSIFCPELSGDEVMLLVRGCDRGCEGQIKTLVDRVHSGRGDRGCATFHSRAAQLVHDAGQSGKVARDVYREPHRPRLSARYVRPGVSALPSVPPSSGWVGVEAPGVSLEKFI